MSALYKATVGIEIHHVDQSEPTYCTGVLVAPTTVLTAASCLDNEINLNVVVGFGSAPQTMIKSGNKNYTRTSHSGARVDVAVVYLDSPAPSWTKPLLIVKPQSRMTYLQITALTAGMNLSAKMALKRADFSVLEMNPDENLFVVQKHHDHTFYHGDAGSAAIVMVNGLPQVLGILTDDSVIGDKESGGDFVNLNNPTLNAWVVSHLK